MLPRRRSVQLLVQLITKSQGNTELLFALDTVCQDLFVSVLRQCSDFCTQVTEQISSL